MVAAVAAGVALRPVDDDRETTSTTPMTTKLTADVAAAAAANLWHRYAAAWMTTTMWLTCWSHRADCAAMTVTVMIGDRVAAAAVAGAAVAVAAVGHRSTCAVAFRAACASSCAVSCYPVIENMYGWYMAYMVCLCVAEPHANCELKYS